MRAGPATQPSADRSDLLWSPGAVDPYADEPVAPRCGDPKLRQRVDHDAFERIDKAAHAQAAAREIEHHVADPLAGTVVGIAPAAACDVDGKAFGVDELVRFGTRARRIERGVLEEPDPFGGGAREDRLDALAHRRERVRVGDEPRSDRPGDRLER